MSTLQSALAINVFQESIQNWHKGLDTAYNPYPENSLEYLFYKKNQIDTIQWHEEDEIRRPDLPANDLVAIKRRIDHLNQVRTDTVEQIDDLVYQLYKEVIVQPGARMNSETPAWLIDRMSILELKIYHMEEQTLRTDVSFEHTKTCKKKLTVLLEQRQDMSACLDQLLEEISLGKRFFKVYRQMKMYNDQTLNPALYKQNV